MSTRKGRGEISKDVRGFTQGEEEKRADRRGRTREPDELVTYTKALPSVHIDVLSPKDQYLNVIDFIDRRNRELSEEYYNGVPITPKKISHRRIDLILTGKPSIALVIEESSGYFCGFRTGDDPDGRSFCFKDTPLPKVKATIIPFLTSNYMKIRPDEEKDMLLGKSSLQNAFFVLSSFDENLPRNEMIKQMKTLKKALAQLIVMFCEAQRFNPVFDFVKSAIESDEPLKLPPDLWAMIKNFSTISRFALHCKEKDKVKQSYDQKEIDMVSEHSLMLCLDCGRGGMG